MIFVDRNVVPAPRVLAAPEEKGHLERAKAIAYYRKKSKRAKRFPFAAYKDPSVKQALRDLFHGKCAYCETSYEVSQPMDVEHWRPKAAIETVKGKKIKPGYYWLAADWSNLLPSCIHCNRASYHLVPPDLENPVKLGKENRFPLDNEKRRARKPGEEIREDPLLLDPCRDHPEDYLAFSLDDVRRGIVQARLNGPGQPNPRAETSIEVYALNREPLVREREQRYLEIARLLKNVERYTKELDAAKDDASREKFAAWLRDEFAELERYKRPEEKYSQLARQMIGSCLEKLTA